MLQHQDKYQEVTTAVYELVIIFDGITFNDIMFQLPQYTEGLVQRSLQLLINNKKIHTEQNGTAPGYFTSVHNS